MNESGLTAAYQALASTPFTARMLFGFEYTSYLVAGASILSVVLLTSAVSSILRKVNINEAWASRQHRAPLQERNDNDGDAVLPRLCSKRLPRISQTSSIKIWKQLYYQLHNLEDFPEVLPQAKDFIVSMLGEATSAARQLPQKENIHELRDFSRNGLESFIALQGKQIARQWNQYVIRRQKGGPRELMRNRAEAERWLKQIAPVKYVDGAWLSNIGRATLPYGLLEVIRNAWQVLSEELGDGVLEQNHVYVYRELLRSIGVYLPPACDADFIDDRLGLDNLTAWKAAVAQLLVCVFPHELLPEILGFNLHFEGITLETLMASKELKELSLDPCYFVLHVVSKAFSGALPPTAR